jgi:hypothetical protein
MAELTMLNENVDGWQDAALVVDEGTGQHYLVATCELPWKPGVYDTSVYPADASGDTGDNDVFVANGVMRDDALADLSARLDEGRLLTKAEAEDIAKHYIEDDFGAFQAWVLGAEPAQV